MTTLAAISSPVASLRSSAPRLARGASGPAVRELQALLNTCGFYGKTVDGKFGPLTEAAVREFQARHGLKVDGWAGPKTMAVLERVAGGSAGPVPPGSVGPVRGSPAPAGAGVQAALAYGKSVLGSPYAAVNPFRFGDVRWDGGRHQSVNGSGTWWQYPRGTRVFDCSGFVVACFRRAGVDLLSRGLATSGAIAANRSGFLENLTRDQLRPGDLITYRSASNGVGHVVIYLGQGRTLESSGSGGVRYGLVDWSRANAFRRVPVP